VFRVSEKRRSNVSFELGVNVKFPRPLRCFTVLLMVVPCSFVTPPEAKKP
jgi:hypothetical protein